MEDKIKFYNELKERVKQDKEYIAIANEAIIDGVKEENQLLRHQKSKVEVGFCIYHTMNKKKIIDQYKPVIQWAIDACTFVPNLTLKGDDRGKKQGGTTKQARKFKTSHKKRKKINNKRANKTGT